MAQCRPFPKRKVFAHLSIAAGNALQLGGMATAVVLIVITPSFRRASFAVAAMLGAWILFYFFCHAITHWAVGRVVGIRFLGYTIGGTANPEGYPSGVRWVFSHLPFLGVRTEKASMRSSKPAAKAIMWSSGVTASAILPTLSAIWCRHLGIPGSKGFLLFALLWAMGTLASNWTSQTGDYAKARRTLAGVNEARV